LATVPDTRAGAALRIAHRAENYAARAQANHPKVAVSIATLADAVDDTRRLLVRRDGLKAVLGALAYLGFDVLVIGGGIAYLFLRSKFGPIQSGTLDPAG
jgi:hypothetical protein